MGSSATAAAARQGAEPTATSTTATGNGTSPGDEGTQWHVTHTGAGSASEQYEADIASRHIPHPPGFTPCPGMPHPWHSTNYPLTHWHIQLGLDWANAFG